MSKSSSHIILALCSVALVAACTTTQSNTANAPVSSPTADIGVVTALKNVDPTKANACIVSAANKYYLPTRVIKAVDMKKSVDGTTQIILKVDIRDAVCVVTAAGNVRSVIDTTPKSADQIAAEQKAKKS